MKKQILISALIASIALGTIGCGSSDDDKKKDVIKQQPAEQEKPKDKQEDNNNPQDDNLDIREDGNITIERNYVTGDVTIKYLHNEDANITQFFIDKDNNTDTGSISSDNQNGTEYKIVNYHDASTTYAIYDYNLSDKSNWTKSDSLVMTNQNLTDSVDSFTLSEDFFIDQNFTVHAESYKINDKNWTQSGIQTKIDFGAMMAEEK